MYWAVRNLMPVAALGDRVAQSDQLQRHEDREEYPPLDDVDDFQKIKALAESQAGEPTTPGTARTIAEERAAYVAKL